MKHALTILECALVLLVLAALLPGCAGTAPAVKSVYDLAGEACTKYFADQPSAADGAPATICRDAAALQPFVDALLDVLAKAGPRASAALKPQPVHIVTDTVDPNPYAADAGAP